jgi:hypothetical protein
MKSDTLLRQDLQVGEVDGWLFLNVPWERAASLHEYLWRRGIDFTLVRDPQTKEAGIDLRAGLNRETVQQLLREWED